MSELLESVTFTDVLGHHNISLEKFNARELDPLSKVPASVEAWIYKVTERHNSIYTDGEMDTVTTYSKTVTYEALTEDEARRHFEHVYREQNGKETIKGITGYQVKAIGKSGDTCSVLFTGATSKIMVMKLRAFDSLGKLAKDAEVFDVEFLYYTNTSVADDVIVITPAN